MVIREVALFVPAMGRHELDNLQGAFGATYVGNCDIGFLVVVKRRDVLEKAVGKNWRRRRILNRPGNGTLAVG